MSRFRRLLAWSLGGLLGCAAVAEVGLRAAGLVDFPVYTTAVDADLGYVPKPLQHGAFLNRNRWFFNDRGMPIATDWKDHPPGPGSTADLLLIGNSIVMGGNAYDQPDKLSPLLEGELDGTFKVWPLAVGGWNGINQMAYLDTQHDVIAGAESFVWQVMSGGFDAATPWRGEYVFPTRRPVSALWYVTRRYVLPRWFAFGDTELPSKSAAQARRLEAFDSAVGEIVAVTRRQREPSGLIYLYPSQDELALAKRGGEWLPERSAVMAVAAKHGLKVLDVANEAGWRASFYRDGVHPTVEGNRALAALIARRMRPNRAAAR